MDFKQKIIDLGEILRSNNEIQMSTWELTPYTSSQKELDQIKHSSGLYSFYNDFKSFTFEWTYLVDEEHEIIGSSNIISLELLLQDWEGNIYFDDYDEDDILRFFHPFDLFVPEAKVGILIEKGNPDVEVYFFDYSDSILSFDLDFDGYFMMLIEAKGFIYWQRGILSIINGEDNLESLQFKKYMPKIFPEFKWEDFVAKYESLRLSKQ